MPDNITNRKLLISGANRGIGKELLEQALSRDAAKVYAAVRAPQSVEPLIDKYGDRVQAIAMDLNLPSSIIDAASKASDVDIVINNAGIMNTVAAYDENAVEALQEEFDVNVYGLMRVAQAFAPALKANGGGFFVQLNSVASIKASGNFATYCASKAASYSITQSLRDRMSQQGTRVISVHPGPTATDMGASAGFGQFATPVSEVAQAILDAINTEEFHAWVGPLAGLVSQHYETFSDRVINGDMQAIRARAFNIDQPQPAS